MVEAIKDLILTIFGSYVWIGIIVLAMIPITELRTALPFAMSSAWGASKLTWWQAYICAVVGSTIPAFIIIPLLLPVFAWLRKTKVFAKMVDAFDKRFKAKSQNIDNKVQYEQVANGAGERKSARIKFWGVVAFVAIPLPLTGAWTGSAVASYLKMHWLKGVLAVFIGNCISGIIMLSICLLWPNATDIIMYIFLGLALLVLIFFIIKCLIKNKKGSEESNIKEEQNS